jgi:hypothetical protein
MVFENVVLMGLEHKRWELDIERLQVMGVCRDDRLDVYECGDV